MEEIEVIPERLTDQCADAGTLPALAGWQPIETAPRNGMPVLLWFAVSAGEISGINHSTGITIGSFSNGCSDFPGNDWWDELGGDMYATWCKPTHWMPLPPPPVQGE